MRIVLLRAYDVSPNDKGYRVLVDRLWPRGIAKAALRLDEWCRELAPSTELRKWFDHRAERWQPFREQYLQELAEKPAEVARLRAIARQRRLLLIYAARDEERNHAGVLREFLLERPAKRFSRRPPKPDA